MGACTVNVCIFEGMKHVISVAAFQKVICHQIFKLWPAVIDLFSKTRRRWAEYEGYADSCAL